MRIIRRLVLWWLLMFWQGGFVFYGAVVVPIGSRVLGTDFAQGMITRQVTVALNVAGAVVLLAWISDLVCEPESRLKRRWGAWLVMVIALGVLFWMHPQLDGYIDVEHYRLLDRSAFRQWHRWYLHTSTVQWLASIALSYWTLQNWRTGDVADEAARRAGANPP